MKALRLSVAVVSALICALAFIAPFYCGWLILCYCIPILLIASEGKGVFGYELFVGTVVFWLIHSWAVGLFCVTSWPVYGTLFFIGFVLYLSISRYVIVMAAQSVGNRLSKNQNAFFFIIGEIIFWYFVSYYSFFIFGNTTGYCLAHPALVLIDTVGFNYVAAKFGARGVLVCIGIINVLLAELFKSGNTKILAAICLLLCVAVQKIPDETSLSPYAWIKPPEETYVFDWVAEVNNSLMQLYQTKYDHISTIIMPESAFPFAYADISQVMSTLNQTNVLENKTFICGAHRKEAGNQTINSLFCANNSPLIKYYDKKTLFPFTEFLPWNWLYTIRAECGFGKSNECKRAVVENVNKFDSGSDFVFFICSDLFFDTQLLCVDGRLQNKTVIFISHDSWCNACCFKELMARYAWLFATCNNTCLYYVSNCYGNCYGASKKERIPLLKSKK